MDLVPGTNTAPNSHSWKTCISGTSAGPSLGVQLPGPSATDRGFVLSAYSHHRTGQLISKVMMSRAEASQDRKDQVIWTEPRNPLSRFRIKEAVKSGLGKALGSRGWGGSCRDPSRGGPCLWGEALDCNRIHFCRGQPPTLWPFAVAAPGNGYSQSQHQLCSEDKEGVRKIARKC